MKTKPKDRAKARRSRMSRELLLRYIFSLVAMVAGLFILFLLGYNLCSRIIWQPYDPLYLILCFVWDYILFFAGLAVLLGWTLITYHFLSKPLSYLDEVVAAAGSLAKPDSGPVTLSPAMADTQNELNLLKERALRDAALAKEAEQRKNDLIVYLAHDLKTPLTSVIGYLSLLRDEPEISPELRARYTGVALDKALRLEDLINEFFDITRFNLTAISLEKENVDLTRLIEQSAFEFEPVLQEKGLRWKLELEKELSLSADGDKLARVFDNLMRNAVNYSYPDSEISVSLKRREGWALAQIKNRGKTIPPEKLSRIFEQFFRLDSSRSSSTGGAGLGLAIAREIVEKHGGTIRAESAEESVCFTVELPLDQ